MASRLALLKRTGEDSGSILGLRRWVHALALPPPLDVPISQPTCSIRNGPKALKPVPVIIRCRSCGRVKLPHFFCCSGDR